MDELLDMIVVQRGDRSLGCQNININIMRQIKIERALQCMQLIFVSRYLNPQIIPAHKNLIELLCVSIHDYYDISINISSR